MTADDMELIIDNDTHKKLLDGACERLIRIVEIEVEAYDVICRKIEDNIWRKSKELIRRGD